MIRVPRKADVLVSSVLAGSLLFGAAGLAAAAADGSGGTAGAPAPTPAALADTRLSQAQTQALRDLRVLLERVTELARAVEEAPGGVLSEEELIKHATAIDSAVKAVRESADKAGAPRAAAHRRGQVQDPTPSQGSGEGQGQGQGQAQAQGQITVPPQAAEPGDQATAPPQAAGDGVAAGDGGAVTPPFAAQPTPSDISTDPLDALQRAIDDLLDAVAAGDANAATVAIPRIADAIIGLIDAVVGPLPGRDFPVMPPLLPFPDEATSLAEDASALAAKPTEPTAATQPGAPEAGAPELGAAKPDAAKPSPEPHTDKPGKKPGKKTPEKPTTKPEKPAEKPTTKPGKKTAEKPTTTAATPLAAPGSAPGAADDSVAPMPLPHPVDADGAGADARP
ncbi:hypothetical protein AB0E27_18125 [Streptomyces sparsogenes]|uniref:hypothetical protein n=1 Tax=Streptomyces sparsogenes TaxID=67365 RepID=UPI003406ACC4